MITATYAAAGILLAAATIPFAHGSIGVKGFGICLDVVFFIASSAASRGVSHRQRNFSP